MNQIEALRQLRTLATPIVETRDVAALLRVSISNATTIMRRLAQSSMVTHLSRGKWLVTTSIDHLALPELLAAPWPAYVSLQSALFNHGLIEQIPAVIYAVTLARPRRLKTPLATLSFHRMPPELFTGFDLSPNSAAKIATPEKALFDMLYLAPGRSRLFSQQPELTIPDRFRWKHLEQYTKLVNSPARRTYILERIRALRLPRRLGTRKGN